MLKIKDNVDLKELEKYGFSYNKNLKNYGIGFLFHGYILVAEKDRLIQPLYDENMWIEMEDIFFDLIQDGLVEKVEKE